MAATAITCIPLESTSEGEMIGSSRAIRCVWNLLQIVARTDAAVLIHDETGTGKELVAKAIREESSRRCGPYVRVNCAAIPAGLLESELFGHERGGCLYAQFAKDLREGTRLAPDFVEATKRHALHDAIQLAAESGVRQIAK
jgi:transcriptional regulator of aromatic amino acid metabolism